MTDLREKNKEPLNGHFNSDWRITSSSRVAVYAGDTSVDVFDLYLEGVDERLATLQFLKDGSRQVAITSSNVTPEEGREIVKTFMSWYTDREKRREYQRTMYEVRKRDRIRLAMEALAKQ